MLQCFLNIYTGPEFLSYGYVYGFLYKKIWNNTRQNDDLWEDCVVVVNGNCSLICKAFFVVVL